MTVIKNKRRVPEELSSPFSACTNAAEHRAELIDHLQTALLLEHSTIPPYLCALYSIKEGTNRDAVDSIRSVALEEMLHMALVANLMNAIGGKPRTAYAGFVPQYPGYLTHSDRSVTVSLNRFSSAALEVFLDIEKPGDPAALPKHDRYSSIGQFYAAIKDELDYFCRTFGEHELFSKPGPQVSPLDYYSGGGEIIEVTNYDSARLAIKVIVDEGEGFGHSIFSGDNEQFGERLDLAHFYKFNELAVGRRYAPEDSPARNPTGPSLAVDFTDRSVHPAEFFETLEKYPEHVRPSMLEFNRCYSQLLRALEDGFNGRTNDERKPMESAVDLMFQVKYHMIDLMRTVIDDDGNTAGPLFQYVEE